MNDDKVENNVNIDRSPAAGAPHCENPDVSFDMKNQMDAFENVITADWPYKESQLLYCEANAIVAGNLRLALRVEQLRLSIYEGGDYLPASELIAYIYDLDQFSTELGKDAISWRYAEYYSPGLFAEQNWKFQSARQTHLLFQDLIGKFELHYTDAIRFFRKHPQYRELVFRDMKSRAESDPLSEFLPVQDILSARWVRKSLTWVMQIVLSAQGEIQNIGVDGQSASHPYHVFGTDFWASLE